MTSTLYTAAAALAHPGPGWGPGGPWRDGDGFGLWWLFPLGWGIFWIALITFAIIAIRRRARAGGWRRDPAEVALGERYARGEIEADEYTERLTVLRRARDPRNPGTPKA